MWAIGGGKGGIGKSVIAANLAVILAQRGSRVVLIDADLGGANLHTILGVSTKGPTLTDFLNRRIERLADIVAPTHTQNVQREKMPLELVLADGSVYPRKGEVAFADRQMDVRTGTIRVATIFPNPNNMLRPGQFARIRAEIEIKKGALVIPQRSITELQGKYLVAVVGPENKVAIKQVKAGARFGQLWVIEQGLQAGEKVVAEGTQKVREGMVVSPKPFGSQTQAEAAGAKKPEAKPQSKDEAK